ncbi:N-acetyl-gamma-glutamyl-phosphate reductase [Salicibibacter halophilus]|uniref:N-acetyl-gamma-glutamyl-phosphate reductase n=1 Tax=Salicibibacter halophilus TaxID=2502791 RepID=A0A514LGH0_9BACI|nr:N-acetyl-gamma-glutamyl-phosphate reductase [Salicibibacter halophilus]QDI90948.1 N-acetyl-gamma-glutamyl-phosphate reductase [Salicibibacter halophilus]
MKVAIVGATGYGGIELIRLLRQHRHVTEVSVFSSTQAEAPLTSTYPHLQDVYKGILQPLDTKRLANEYDVVFLSAPPGVAASLAGDLLEGTAAIVDLSGDFRIKEASVYEAWYGREAADATIARQAVYGLSEWNGEKIGKAQIVANPGCYPTAILLGLAPAVKNNGIDMKSVIIDAKTGTTGAGKNPSPMTHFSEMNESMKIYKVNEHKHTPEIEQQLFEWNEEADTVTFTPHLVPMSRGIMATMYATCPSDLSAQEWIDAYKAAYEGHPFVRVREDGFPATKEVYGSNYCDIFLDYDSRTNRLTIVSVIDNLVKGAAGQAIQNANLMNGFEATAGLELFPIYP